MEWTSANLIFDRIHNKSTSWLDVTNSNVVNCGDSYDKAIP